MAACEQTLRQNCIRDPTFFSCARSSTTGIFESVAIHQVIGDEDRPTKVVAKLHQKSFGCGKAFSHGARYTAQPRDYRSELSINMSVWLNGG